MSYVKNAQLCLECMSLMPGKNFRSKPYMGKLHQFLPVSVLELTILMICPQVGGKNPVIGWRAQDLCAGQKGIAR